MRLLELGQLRVGVLGFGREGRAAASILTEARPDIDLTVLIESGAPPDGYAARVGSFDDHLLDYDVLIRSPGVPVLHPAVQRFQAAGGRVVNPASIWFAERPGLPVIGVTGSKGKSTTASMLAHLLRLAGRGVLLAGNIGVPLLAHLNTEADVVVLELSSYQLADLDGRLSLGLMTRLFPEHGDWHGGVEHYYASKRRMIGLLKGAPLLVNARDEVLLAQTADAPNRVLGNRAPLVHRRGEALYRGSEYLLDLDQLDLLGRHNLDNAALALEAAVQQAIPLGSAVAGLRSFHPLAHRLEPVVDRAGLRWINDSIATTPHATLAALEAMSGEPVVLIAGGYVRPADWAPVVEHCRRHRLRGLVLLPDSGQAVASAFENAGVMPLQPPGLVENLSEAVTESARLAGDKATILLSPGAASFPHFQDFEHRGRCFRLAVEAYYNDRSTA